MNLEKFGSAHLRVYTYTREHNTEKRKQTYILLRDSNPHSQCSSGPWLHALYISRPLGTAHKRHMNCAFTFP